MLDLDVADRRWLGEGAVSAALGGRRTELPDVYCRSSPIARLPIGSPVAVVCGLQDNVDLLDISRGYAAAARAAGDEVTLLEDRGDHFSVIDPDSLLWSRTATLIESRVPPGPSAAGASG